MENTENVYEDKTVKDFIHNLRIGQSFLQEPNKEPDYYKNFITKKVYTDVNMLIVNQGMKNHDKLSNIVISQNEIHQNNYLIAQNSKSIGTAMFRNFNAFYGKDDPEVKANKATVGEHKLDDKGEPVRDIIYSNLFAAEDVYLTKFKASRDNEGNIQHYEEDVFSVTNGEIDTYKKPYSYTDKKGVEHKFNKGDQVILHSKGSIMGDYVSTNQTLVAGKKSYLPPYIENEDMAPLYKRKDNSAKEILVEKMTEAFRGKLMGNYEGMKIKNSEIDAIEKEFLQHPRQFRGLLRVAQTRAEGDKEIIAKMDAAIAAKKESEKNVNENQKTNSKKR